jgi:hypothetical protein
MNALLLICLPCLTIGLLGLFVGARAIYELRRARLLLREARATLARAVGIIECESQRMQ